jgi:hypothetical protein
VQPTPPPHRLDRRTFLTGAAALALAACSGSDEATPASSTTEPSTAPDPVDAADDTNATTDALAGTDPSEDAPAGSDPAPLTASLFDALAVCALTPSAAEGPFPSIEQLDRADITEGYPGHPLRLGLRVVDQACRPIPDSRVEIWHTDATGDYSSYQDNGSGKDEGAGTTFLRGIRTADAEGIVEFQTLYPGWYEGRAVHIHVTAWIGSSSVLTTQLYFDEAYTEAVYRAAPYAEFGPPDTGWADDRLIGNPIADGTAITLTEATTSRGPGTLGLVNLGLPSPS